MAKSSRSYSRSGRRFKAASQTQSENVQTKLKIGSPGDQFEKEADQVADKLVDSNHTDKARSNQPIQSVQRQFLHRQAEKEEPAQAKFIQKQGQQEEDEMQRQEEKEEPVQTKFLQAQEEKEEPAQAKSLQKQGEEEEPMQAKFLQAQEEKEEPAQAKFIQRFSENETMKTTTFQPSFQRKSSSGKSEEQKPSFDFKSLLEKTKAGGRPLDDETRKYMESKMGHDFSSVRIHTGPDAIMLAKHVHAQAFTVGNHIFFNVGKYQTETEEGLKLLAHELTHVIQQGF